jgi:hypothetical protein
MSDANPPDEPPSSDPGDTPGEPDKPGLAQRFRKLPVWAQVLISALAGGVLVVAGLLIANAVSSPSSSTATAPSTELTTTTTPSHGYTHAAAVLVLVTQLAHESSTPTTQPATTTATTPSTAAPTTPSSTATTEPATTTPATTEPATSTTAPPTTESPTTESPTTAPSTTAPRPTRPTSTVPAEPATTTPATTEPATSTTAPPSTAPPPGGGLPPGTLAASPPAFAAAWNQSVQGTEVPALSAGPSPPPNFTQESVAGVAAYVANLGGNVWLVALAQTPGAAIAQALLIWEPNVDSAELPAQNALYRDAFQALMKTVNNSITALQRLKVTGQLGLTRRQPPYPDSTQKSALQAPHQYDLFNLDPAHPTQPGPATVISVITSQS